MVAMAVSLSRKGAGGREIRRKKKGRKEGMGKRKKSKVRCLTLASQQRT